MFDQLRKYAAAYAVAIGGVVLTCWSSWNVREELQSSHRREFQWAASDRIESVRAVVDQGLDALREIRGLFYAAHELDESAFSAFADPILQRRPYIASLLWAPLLNAPRQEPSAAVIGGAPTTTAAVNDDPLGSEREQLTRIPVVLAASRAISELAKGVDLNTSSELAALFARARENGKIAVSGRMTLTRPGRNSLSVIYAALPIYAPASPQSSPAPEGFVLGVYDIEELLHFAIKRLEPRGVEVLVRRRATRRRATTRSSSRSSSISTPAVWNPAPPRRPPAGFRSKTRISHGWWPRFALATAAGQSPAWPRIPFVALRHSPRRIGQ
jgi:CHASE1-domain containing sensor protein